MLIYTKKEKETRIIREIIETIFFIHATKGSNVKGEEKRKRLSKDV